MSKKLNVVGTKIKRRKRCYISLALGELRPTNVLQLQADYIRKQLFMQRGTSLYLTNVPAPLKAPASIKKKRF